MVCVDAKKMKPEPLYLWFMPKKSWNYYLPICRFHSFLELHSKDLSLPWAGQSLSTEQREALAWNCHHWHDLGPLFGARQTSARIEKAHGHGHPSCSDPRRSVFHSPPSHCTLKDVLTRGRHQSCRSWKLADEGAACACFSSFNRFQERGSSIVQIKLVKWRNAKQPSVNNAEFNRHQKGIGPRNICKFRMRWSDKKCLVWCGKGFWQNGPCEEQALAGISLEQLNEVMKGDQRAGDLV